MGLFPRLFMKSWVIKMRPKRLSISQIHSSALDQDIRLPLIGFTNSLYRNTLKQRENLIMSPPSILFALNMVLLGAKPSSKTEKELINVLEYHNISGGAQKVHETYKRLLDEFKQLNEKVAKNSHRSWDSKKPTELDFWTMAITKDGFKPSREFLDDIKNYYNSSLEQYAKGKPKENQQLLNRINKWAKDAGFADDLISKGELDNPALRLMLITAIKLQSYWFDEFCEVKRRFFNHGSAESVTNVTFLSEKFQSYHDFKTITLWDNKTWPSLPESLAGSEVVCAQVPLRDEIKLNIMCPKNVAGSAGSELQWFEDCLWHFRNSNFSLSHILDALDNQKPSKRPVILEFPKFSFENGRDLIETLQKMGLKTIFTPDAELDRIGPDLFISKVQHQALVEVNKFGLKAAAYTKIMVPTMARPTPPVKILIDRPFMFAVTYKKVPLFVGRVVKV